jgi:NAD(P)-dependent dehydrogenase (short-subunit alcohol dehydrogenase family)
MHDKPVALVTGANKGIGLQIAKDLAAHGFTVLVGSRNLEDGETAAKSVGADARPLQLDVTSQGSISSAAERIRSEFGRLDVLVNNAGISHAGKPGRSLEEIVKSGRLGVASLDEIRAVFETNVFGVIAVTQAMLPLLREAPAARIELHRFAHPELGPGGPAPRHLRHLLFIEDGAQRDHPGLRLGPGVDRYQGKCCVPGLYRDGPQQLRGHADGPTGLA